MLIDGEELKDILNKKIVSLMPTNLLSDEDLTIEEKRNAAMAAAFLFVIDQITKLETRGRK